MSTLREARGCRLTGRIHRVFSPSTLPEKTWLLLSATASGPGHAASSISPPNTKGQAGARRAPVIVFIRRSSERPPRRFLNPDLRAPGGDGPTGVSPAGGLASAVGLIALRPGPGS